MPTAEESVPFRWDLITPDQLGSLLSSTTAPDLWFLNDLHACTGKVVARSGNGDLVFVGRPSCAPAPTSNAATPSNANPGR